MEQKGFTTVVAVLIVFFLIISIGVGVFLVNQQTNLKSKAAEIFLERSSSLRQASETEKGENEKELRTDVEVDQAAVLQTNGFYLRRVENNQPVEGEQFRVRLYARSDTEAANLFSAKLHFTKEVAKVISIKNDFALKLSLDNYFNNQTGEVSIASGVPNPGIKSEGKDLHMADIVFEAKQKGVVDITFDNTSAIFRNSDNQNIIKVTENLSVQIYDKQSRMLDQSQSNKQQTINSAVSVSQNQQADSTITSTPSPMQLVHATPIPAVSPIATSTPMPQTTNSSSQSTATPTLRPTTRQNNPRFDFNSDGKVSFSDIFEIFKF